MFLPVSRPIISNETDNVSNLHINKVSSNLFGLKSTDPIFSYPCPPSMAQIKIEYHLELSQQALEVLSVYCKCGLQLLHCKSYVQFIKAGFNDYDSFHVRRVITWTRIAESKTGWNLCASFFQLFFNFAD